MFKTLSFRDILASERLREYNQCHEPSGPTGGQFCSTGSGGKKKPQYGEPGYQTLADQGWGLSRAEVNRRMSAAPPLEDFVKADRPKKAKKITASEFEGAYDRLHQAYEDSTYYDRLDAADFGRGGVDREGYGGFYTRYSRSATTRSGKLRKKSYAAMYDTVEFHWGREQMAEKGIPHPSHFKGLRKT